MKSRQTDGSETKTSVNGIEVREFGRRGTLVRLSGEFDVDDLDVLRRTLAGISGTGRPVRVDLSGVTFLDVLCARALVSEFGGHRGAHLLLRAPSWQARSSLRACSSEEANLWRGVDGAGEVRP